MDQTLLDMLAINRSIPKLGPRVDNSILDARNSALSRVSP